MAISHFDREQNGNDRTSLSKKFEKHELIFDADETAAILKFIFKSRHQTIDRLEINDRIREFAQGLLLEAVDASYALGFVEAIFRATMNPGAGTRSILKKFGKKALKHWFKHATAEDLSQIRIYEVVRAQLELNFGRVLLMYANGIAKSQVLSSGFILYAVNYPQRNGIVWG